MKLEEEAFTTVTTFLIDLRVFIASFWREILQPQGRVHQTTPPPPCPHLHNRTRSPHPAIFAAKSRYSKLAFKPLPTQITLALNINNSDRDWATNGSQFIS